jgi:sugar O-acyltransferase (sialic acid O-acetyltransferase NeuD family)
MPLLIFPCHGTGIEALDCLGSTHRCVGFIDDTPAKQGKVVAGVPVLDRGALHRHPEAALLAVSGGPTTYRSRAELIAGFGVAPPRFTTVVHPKAVVSPLAVVGRNVLVMAGAVVTSNAVIGDHVVILPNAVVHHDVAIGPYSLIGANVTIAGGCVLGEGCYIGSGASIKNGLAVGNGALVGLGSTVLHDVPAGEVVAGTPARTLQRRA